MNDNSCGDLYTFEQGVLGGGMPSNLMDLSTTKKIMTIVSIIYYLLYLYFAVRSNGFLSLV